MKRLALDLEELCLAMDSAPGDLSWYLDVESGAVVLVNNDYDPAEMEPSLEELEKSPERYLPVPPSDATVGYGDMEGFLATVEEPTLRESLELALSGAGPMRRFKNVLAHVPEHRQRWAEFKAARLEARARDWLASLEIEPLPLRRAS